jgi:hypothetical protein
MWWAMHVARFEEVRIVYAVLIGKYQRKRRLGRPNLICEDNIKTECYIITGLSRLTQDRVQWRGFCQYDNEFFDQMKNCII